MKFIDQRGQEILKGARVTSTSYGYGTPKGADRGTVVGFGRTNVAIHWAGYLYDQEVPFHLSRPDQIRVTAQPRKTIQPN